MLAIIFLIQAESASKQREEVHNQQTEQQVARVEELEKRIKEYEEKEQRFKTVNLEDQLSEYEQDVKQTTQKIQGLYAQLDKAIQHKDTSLQRYQNVLADMETKYNDKVHHLEDKNIQQKQNFEQTTQAKKQLEQKSQNLVAKLEQLDDQLEDRTKTIQSYSNKNKELQEEILKKAADLKLNISQLNTQHQQTLADKAESFQDMIKRLEQSYQQTLARIAESHEQDLVRKEQIAQQRLVQKENVMKAALVIKDQERQDAVKIALAEKEAQLQKTLVDQQAQARKVLTDKEAEHLKSLAEKEVQLQKTLAEQEAQFQKILMDRDAQARKALAEQEAQRRKALTAKQGSKLAEEESKEYSRALADLKRQLQDKEGQLEKLKQQGNELASKHKALRNAKAKIDKELAGERKAKQAKQKITDRLKELEKHGAIVTQEGEVILPLETNFFRRDDYVIQVPLQDFLKEIVPRYAKLLCGEPEHCDQIKEVKIGGYASPVYEGRYVGIQDESLWARYAQDYNLNLSFKRAQAVFHFVKFDMVFAHKAEFMKKLTDVSGHGYLKAKAVPKEYVGKLASCEDEYNCEQERYVVLTFQTSSGENP